MSEPPSEPMDGAKALEMTTTTPHNNDVLCGRGGTVNAHPGNEQYRKFVDRKKRLYLTARFKREKRLISSKIVDEIRNLDPPGRFLLKDANSNVWRDIGDEKARDKTSQALRENALTVRRQLEDDFKKSQMHQMSGGGPLPPPPQKPNIAAGKNPDAGLAVVVAVRGPPTKSGWPPPPQAPWGYPRYDPTFPHPRHSAPPHDPNFPQPQYSASPHLPPQQGGQTKPPNYPYFPPPSQHPGGMDQPPEVQQHQYGSSYYGGMPPPPHRPSSQHPGGLQQPAELQQQQHDAHYYGGMSPPPLQPPHHQYPHIPNGQSNHQQQQQNPTSSQSSMPTLNLPRSTTAALTEGQTQQTFMSYSNSNDSANADPPNAPSPPITTSQPSSTAPAIKDTCQRASLFNVDEGSSHDRREFQTDQQRDIGNIPLVISPMKRMHPRKQSPTFGAPPGSIDHAPKTPSVIVSTSQMSRRQSTSSSQADTSQAYSQNTSVTQATPLTFLSTDLSFKSRDNQDMELTHYLQGLEDEISGDVGQEVELVAHAPMFDGDVDTDGSILRSHRHCKHNRQRQHHGGIPAYSRSTPPRHHMSGVRRSGGSRSGGSMSGSIGISDSDRYSRKRRNGSHIPSNSGKVQLDLSTLGGEKATLAAAGGGGAPAFSTYPQDAPASPSHQAKGSPNIPCGDMLTSSIQSFNRCPNLNLSPMSPVSLDLDKMSLCGTENVSQGGGSIGGVSLCNVFDDPSESTVVATNLMDMTMSLGSHIHPSTGVTDGSGGNNNARIGLGLHQAQPSHTDFGDNYSSVHRMDMSVGSGTPINGWGAGSSQPSNSSGGSSSRSRRSGSPASIDKASVDGNWKMEDTPAPAKTQDTQFTWDDIRDE